MTSEHSQSLSFETGEEPCDHHKGVALKRTLEDHAFCASEPEAKKMANAQQDPSAMMSANPGVISEDWSVPDKMVGLIIGRDGKQILKLQQDSQCKVQLTSESNGTADRPCKLTGSKQSIDIVKEMISSLIQRGQDSAHKSGGPNGLNETTIEVPCPPHKAGLIIGRGGETIRNLQERTGTKMVVVQDSSSNPHMEKPIRITGEQSKVDHAKRLVLDLINGSSNGGHMGGGLGMERGGGGFSSPGGMGLTPVPNEPGMITRQVYVPKQAVGVVIGKQGDTIKRIQQETGARVQFQQAHDESQPTRMCTISGPQLQGVEAANAQIQELIKSVLQRDDENGGSNGFSYGGSNRGFRGGGRGGFRGGRGGGGRGMCGSPLGHMQSPTLGPDQSETQVQVPAAKCGLIIGKGGESIRSLMSQTNTYIELARDTPPNSTEKYFTIRGTDANIEAARALISEKIGGSNMMSPPNGSTPSGYQPNYGGQYPAANQYSNVSSNMSWGQPSPYQPSSNGTTQWGRPPSTSTPNGDMSKDPNAGWSMYSYYQQNAAQAAQAQSGAPTPTGASSNIAGQSATSQTDYSLAWIDYYRQMGMFTEAEYYERATQNQTAAQSQVGVAAAVMATPTPVQQNGSWGASPYGQAQPYGAAASTPQPYGSYGYN